MMTRVKRTSYKPAKFRLRPFSRALLRCFHRLQSRQLINRAGWGALATLPSLAVAGPGGESVVAGNVDVVRPDAASTQINQTSQNAIVNWSTFSIDGNEYVLIQQPNSSSTILNRVIGSQQSRILGQLQANGRVFLVNPQGVYVGPGASIDVGAITLSALDIKDQDFLNGDYIFSGKPTNGVVENHGAITAANGGFVVLAGDYVNNTGVITATLGTVALAAGKQVTLDVDNDGLVGFAVDEATVAELAGVENVGEIIADGGRVVMTASVANDLVATAVNNQGLVRAQRIEEKGGEIYLTGYGGDVVNGGTLDVRGANDTSGGQALVYATDDIVLEKGSKILASGDGQRPGGSVRVIANGNLNFKKDALVEADGGGFVELSGHEGIQVRGAVEVGRGGEIVIDPAVLTIQNDSSNPHSSSTGSYGSPCPTNACVGKGFIENRLDNGNNVILVASQEITASGGPFTINATSGSSDGGVGDLSMKIGTGGTGVNCSAFGVCTGTGGFSATSSGHINLSNINIDIQGDFTVSAGTNIGNVNLGSIRAGNVSITAGSTAGNINVGPATAIGPFSGTSSASLATGGLGGLAISAASTDLNLTALGGNINVAGNVTLTGDSFTGVEMHAGGNVNVNGNISAIASTGSAEIDLEGANLNVAGSLLASGPTAARVDARATSNISISGSVRAAAPSGNARVFVDGDGVVRVGAVTAQGSSANVSMRGGNLTFGAIDVSAASFANFFAYAMNDLNANGLVSVSEAGGGFAHASFGGGGLVTINGGVNVAAGPGGVARVSFGGSDGTALNNLVINQQVVADGAAGDSVNFFIANSARTVGNGLVRSDLVRIHTDGSAPIIDLDTLTPQIRFDVFGGRPDVLLNNTAHNGPTSILFGSSAQFRAATFLANTNLNFLSGFSAHSLLVGAPNGVVNFQGPVFISGTSPFTATAPDLSLFNIMASRGLSPPTHGPNVQILGGNGINIPNPFVLGGADPFIKLFSNVGFNTPGLTSALNANSVLAVFNPINLAAPIFLVTHRNCRHPVHWDFLIRLTFRVYRITAGQPLFLENLSDNYPY